MDTLRSTFWIVAICLVVGFALFAILGAFPTSAVGLFVVMGVLAVLIVVHLLLQSRSPSAPDRRGSLDRERRGF